MPIPAILVLGATGKIGAALVEELAAWFREIASLLTKVAAVPWRYNPQEPDLFFRTVTAVGADQIYMACVRNVFERTRSPL
jgi:uncharacterized protein YbjT (DUF2867 family)